MLRFLFVVLFVSCAGSAWAQVNPMKFAPPLNGDMLNLVVLDKPTVIPDIALFASDKGKVRLSSYKTKLVVLNIWATWCPPCLEELPSLNALQYAMGSNIFDVVTVSLDSNSAESIKKFLIDHELMKLPSYVDVDSDIQKLEVIKDMPAIPITLIIDPQSRVLAKLEGPADWNGRDVRAVLEYYAKNVSYAPIF